MYYYYYNNNNNNNSNEFANGKQGIIRDEGQQRGVAERDLCIFEKYLWETRAGRKNSGVAFTKRISNSGLKELNQQVFGSTVSKDFKSWIK